MFVPPYIDQPVVFWDFGDENHLLVPPQSYLAPAHVALVVSFITRGLVVDLTINSVNSKLLGPHLYHNANE